MNQQKALEDIKYIKEMISSSTQYTNLSGIAAILSGCIAICGAILSHNILKTWEVSNLAVHENLWPLVAIWSSVFFISAIIHIHFIFRKAKQTGQPAWSRLAKLVLFAFSPSIFVGGVLGIFLILQQQFLWIPGILIIFYGLGTWSAGIFTILEPRWLGVACIITGITGLFVFLPYGVWMMALTFGLYHIIYGTCLYLRYGG